MRPRDCARRARDESKRQSTGRREVRAREIRLRTNASHEIEAIVGDRDAISWPTPIVSIQREDRDRGDPHQTPIAIEAHDLPRKGGRPWSDIFRGPVRMKEPCRTCDRLEHNVTVGREPESSPHGHIHTVHPRRAVATEACLAGRAIGADGVATTAVERVGLEVGASWPGPDFERAKCAARVARTGPRTTHIRAHAADVSATPTVCAIGREGSPIIHHAVAIVVAEVANLHRRNRAVAWRTVGSATEHRGDAIAVLIRFPLIRAATCDAPERGLTRKVCALVRARAARCLDAALIRTTEATSLPGGTSDLMKARAARIARVARARDAVIAEACSRIR
jgi:hypothetical protein